MKTLIQQDLSTLMFTTAVLIIAKTWKQPMCPSIHYWIKKIWNIYISHYIFMHVYTHTYVCAHTHTHTGILLSHKKIEILSFVAMWINLKNMMLNKINQRRKTKTIQYYLYGKSKIIKINIFSKTETD